MQDIDMLTNLSAAGLLTLLAYIAIRYLANKNNELFAEIKEREKRISQIENERREDAIRTLEVLSDVTQVMKEISGGQTGIAASFDKLSSDIGSVKDSISAHFTRLEDVIRGVR